MQETAEPQPTESQADILTDLVERGKTAADDGQLEVAERMALQAMVGARGAKDSYLSGRSPYTKQQLAHWFGTCAYTLNSVSDISLKWIKINSLNQLEQSFNQLLFGCLQNPMRVMELNSFTRETI